MALPFKVVLIEPEIPPNTGNVARLCAATSSELHLIGPLGFRLDNAALKRAGMDYWRHVSWRLWDNWPAFAAQARPADRLWFVESGGPRRYSDARFQPGDYLIFGRETAGAPRELVQSRPDAWLRIPMFNDRARSLNLSNCVALVLYEALRQNRFENEL